MAATILGYFHVWERGLSNMDGPCEDVYAKPFMTASVFGALEQERCVGFELLETIRNGPSGEGTV